MKQIGTQTRASTGRGKGGAPAPLQILSNVELMSGTKRLFAFDPAVGKEQG